MRIIKEGAELVTAEKKLNNLLILCQNCVFGALITNSLLFLKTNGRLSLASPLCPCGFCLHCEKESGSEWAATCGTH